jgi:hypothetical protein
MTDHEPLPDVRPRTFLDWVADVPWGIFAFLIILILGLVDMIVGFWRLAFSDYLTAVGAGAGLLGIGHGIRTQKRTPPG